MKKVFSILMVSVMIVAMGITAFAVPDNFVSSPTANQAPAVSDVSSSDENFKGEIVVTPYASRNNLAAEKLDEIQGAFSGITSAADLTAVSAGLRTIAANRNIAPANLAVSDLFDLSEYNDDGYQRNGTVTVTLKSSSFRNFVALLHYVNSQWEIVENARLGADGETLTFTVDSFSPFAVVVNTDSSVPSSPQTGYDFPVEYVCGAIAFCAAAVVFFAMSKRAHNA